MEILVTLYILSGVSDSYDKWNFVDSKDDLTWHECTAIVDEFKHITNVQGFCVDEFGNTYTSYKE